MERRTRRGFTIIELLIVVAVIAIVASIALPRMMGAKMSANETSAVATLRALVTAQMQTQTAASIDTDGDGIAEYGYLGELAGSAPVRVAVGGAPAAGVAGVDEIEPSPLIQALGRVANGVVTHSGYVFQLWLADAAGAGVAEDATGGKLAAPFPDSDNSEIYWCAYGWPISAGGTGNKAFFVNQEGVVLQSANRGAGAYGGTATPPAFDAAYTGAGDMTSPMANNIVGVDGRTWVPVQ
jgi:prepilin-type N-terminal cleavage/methylation domain-containing protein